MLGPVFLFVVLALMASPAAGQAITCGTTITQNITLTADLSCKGDGIIVGRDGIVLDLGGRTITGPGKGGWVWPGRALSSVGIKVSGRSGVVVKNGLVQNFATGLLLERSKESQVTGLSATQNHYGVYLYEARGNTISGFKTFANVYGFHVHASSDNLITRGHTYKNGHSPGGYGLVLYSSTKNTVTENSIEQNQTVGIWVIDSRENQIFRNNLVENRPNAVDETGGNSWHDSKTRQGNFWSDYRVAGASADGIGRSPYRIGGFGGTGDNFPFLKRDGWVTGR